MLSQESHQPHSPELRQRKVEGVSGEKLQETLEFCS